MVGKLTKVCFLHPYQPIAVFFMTKTKQKLDALEKLIKLMKDDSDLPRSLQIIFEELHDYILRNE